MKYYGISTGDSGNYGVGDIVTGETVKVLEGVSKSLPRFKE